MAAFIKSLLVSEDPERMKKLIKRLDDEAPKAIAAVIDLAETELMKLQELVKTDPLALTEDSVLTFRKSLIAIQLFARQMVAPEAIIKHLERLMQLVRQIFGLPGSSVQQSLITLKIDGISLYGKLLQAFEDDLVRYSDEILQYIAKELEAHRSIDQQEQTTNVSSSGSPTGPAITLNPFELMTIRELYSELISQAVDVSCSLVLVSPSALARNAAMLFPLACTALSQVTDYNCKYEIIELLAQLSLLALKSGEEQTEDEDFLDFEMRQIQGRDESLLENRLYDISQPVWNFSNSSSSSSQLAASFNTLTTALLESMRLFDSEVYSDNEEDEEDGEDDGDEDDEESSLSVVSTSSSAEPSGVYDDIGLLQDKNTGHGTDGHGNEGSSENKRKQDEAGTSSVIALISGLTFKYFSAEEHSQTFKLVLESLLHKIEEAFSTPKTYSKLPSMLDAVNQLMKFGAPALVQASYNTISSLLEKIIKALKIWKSENPTPFNRRVFANIRADLTACYSTLVKVDPVSSWEQCHHFMTCITYLLADPGILADYASSLATIRVPQDRAAQVKQKLVDDVLVKIVDSYLKELANKSASASMKKYVMKSMGKLALGVGSLFVPQLEVVAPVLLYLGRQSPEFAPCAITAVAQMLSAVKDTPQAAEILTKSVEYAIAMIMEDIYMSGLEGTGASSSDPASSSSSQIRFNFPNKAKSLDEDDEEEEDEEDDESQIQDDNLTELVYKGECFLGYLLHIPEIITLLPTADAGSIPQKIFNCLMELEEKPTLFEEDAMLKMTAVDIILHLVQNISATHTKQHQAKALKTLGAADVDHFDEELSKVIKRIEAIQFK